MGKYKKYSRRYKTSSKKPNGKIGYCANSDLNIQNSTGNSSGGHYVYIRRRKSNGMCTVSTVTSLENHRRNINVGKMAQVRNGNIYPIPKNDSNFNRWSGVNKSTLQVHESKIKNIGYKHIKNRHHFMIGKN